MKNSSRFILITIFLSISIIVIALFTRTEIRDHYTLVNRIKQLEQLITAKQIYREVIYSKETKDFLWIPMANKEFLFALDYSITAGIDISKGWDVKNRNGVKVITLPRAEVFSIDADDKSIREYFIKQRFSRLTRDDYFKLIQDSKEDIIKSQGIKNLLKESENNAEALLKSLLQLSGIQVEVEFSDKYRGSLQ